MDLACFDLANSLAYDHTGVNPAEDRLDRPGWLGHFQARWGLADAGEPAPAALARLRELRALLRELIEGLAAGTPPPDAALERLNGFLAAPVRRHLARADAAYRLTLRPASRDWDWALAEIAASFATLLTEHDPSRVRVCENADCRWTFYDESRSRTRRWCEDACGNLVKVRRFRAKQRHGPAG